MAPISHKPVVLACFAALALLLYLTVDDYGISWDEAVQRHHGLVSLDYAAGKLGIEHDSLAPGYDLENYKWAHYGMLYQMTATLMDLELGYGESDYFEYYRLRHLLNLALYLVALICFYRTLRLRWPAERWYPLLGTLLLVLSPRIYGHAFFNPKDHILLVGYVVASYTLLRFLKFRSWSSLLLHAFATALALNTRLPALLLMVTTVILLLWEQLAHRPGNLRRLGMAAVYVVASFALMVPFFPYLWEDTFTRLAEAFAEMSNFDWGGINLLFGNRLSPADLPAYYIPAWIAITTPLPQLLLLLTGMLVAGVAAFAGLRRGRLWRDYLGMCDFAQLGLSVGPILVVIILGSTLYNGWRHMHFVYPGMVFLAVTGFHWWRERFPRAAPWVLAGGLCLTAINVVRYHPHEYVFFNVLIQGNPLLARFDMDYWGVGFREALIELARQIPEGETRGVFCNSWPCQDNILSLPQPYRGRLRIERDAKRADYLGTNYLYDDAGQVMRHEIHYAEPVVEIAPAGHLTIGIYRLHPTQ